MHDLAQEWMSAIRPLCPQQTRLLNANLNSEPNTGQHSGVNQMRSLYLSLLEAHRLPVKCVPHPFVIISLNNVKVCRTQVKCPPDPIWEEDFVLEDIPSDVTSFTFTLFNKGKRSKVGLNCISILRLINAIFNYFFLFKCFLYEIIFKLMFYYYLSHKTLLFFPIISIKSYF